MHQPSPASTEAEAPAANVPRGGWSAVALLWVCGFCNYADRQAVFAVFPLLAAEFELSKEDRGLIGSAFMIVYALASPLTGLLVDRYARRWLIALGLGVWSVVCALTGLAGSFQQLLVFRAAEGLGESCYFPASMSLLADYHGPRTRSRAMSLHQTSVYAGTALGGILAGWLGQQFGWRSPFWVLGVIGVLYALWLPTRLSEPPRAVPAVVESDPSRRPWWHDLGAVLASPAVVALLLTFIAANFVAMTLLAWLQNFVYEKYNLDLKGAAFVAALFLQLPNLIGALLGGVLADRLGGSGSRALVQGIGLLLGAPCVYLVGWTDTFAVMAGALVAIGLCKGVYDANIFAALFDVVRPEVRGLAAGLMNTVGWAGAALAPTLVGAAGDRIGLSRAIAATAGLYVIAGVLALVASGLTRASARRQFRAESPSAVA